jgi:hypothetical protein
MFTFFCFATLMTSSFKCNTRQLGTVSVMVEIANKLFDLIHSVVTKSDDLRASVKNIYDATNVGIAGKKDIKEIAFFWEKYWEQIGIKYLDLQTEVEALRLQADEYFMALAQNNSQIIDPELKKQDRNKNLDMQNRWNIEYNLALASLSEAGSILNGGNDFLLLLKNAVLREEIEKQLPQLIMINNQADLLSSKIKTFETKSKIIFNYSK